MLFPIVSNGRMPGMPGTNLTREEAQTRAGLLAVESYTVDLDLTVSDKVFESTTVLRFTCSERPFRGSTRLPRRARSSRFRR